MILLSSAHSIMSFKAINITFFPTSCDSLIRKSCEEQTIPENFVDRKQHFRSVLVSPGESVVVCGDASPSDEISFSSPFSSADVDSPKKKPKSTPKSTSQPPSSPVLSSSHLSNSPKNEAISSSHPSLPSSSSSSNRFFAFDPLQGDGSSSSSSSLYFPGGV